MPDPTPATGRSNDGMAAPCCPSLYAEDGLSNHTVALHADGAGVDGRTGTGSATGNADATSSSKPCVPLPGSDFAWRVMAGAVCQALKRMGGRVGHLLADVAHEKRFGRSRFVRNLTGAGRSTDAAWRF